MTILQAIFLGLVQGLTEFIPVSSSGHLVLLHNALGVSNGGLSFDVALHVGTLVALLIYFYKDLLQLGASLFKKTKQTKLAYMLLMATIPAAIVGVLLEQTAESTFRSATLVSVNLIVMAFIMLLAERYSKSVKNKVKLDKATPKQAMTMGLSQAVSIVPGVSRSGSTIVAGLFTGLDRVSATRFSFLLGIPITLGAVAKVFTGEDAISTIRSEKTFFIVGVITAFLSGIFAINFMLKYLSRHSLNLFAYYRIIIGVAALLLLFIF